MIDKGISKDVEQSRDAFLFGADLTANANRVDSDIFKTVKYVLEGLVVSASQMSRGIVGLIKTGNASHPQHTIENLFYAKPPCAVNSHDNNTAFTLILPVRLLESQEEDLLKLLESVIGIISGKDPEFSLRDQTKYEVKKTSAETTSFFIKSPRNSVVAKTFTEIKNIGKKISPIAYVKNSLPAQRHPPIDTNFKDGHGWKKKN